MATHGRTSRLPLPFSTAAGISNTLGFDLEERREMIAYPAFQTKGWQIGSGPTEATCKTLTARLKGSGMRWGGDNAEAVMGLEALYQSGQWDAYWRSELQIKP